MSGYARMWPVAVEAVSRREVRLSGEEQTCCAHNEFFAF